MRNSADDDLDKMKNQIFIMGEESLSDIQNVKIDTKLPKEERVKAFLEQIGNPYHFRCNGHVVRVSFSDTDRTLEDCLQDYFNTLI